MYQPPTSSTARAFRRIHGAIAACCWLFGLCLAAQTVMWAVISFTSIRVDEVPPTDHQGDVVSTDEVRPQSISSALRPPRTIETPEVSPVETRPSAWDGRLRWLAGVFVGVGTVAGIMMAPLAAIGVFLSIALSIVGCERAATAFIGLLLLSILTLPLRSLLHSVEFEGLLLPYDALTAASDSFASGQSGWLIFFARHLILPAVCLMMVTLCTMRFRDGLESGMFSREVAEADAALDREASNLAATSLRGGGRAATALGRVSHEPDGMPSATKVSPGEMPRRLI